MQKVKFKKSVIQGKKPSSLEPGEIAINYNAKTPFLSFQASGDTSEIVQIAPTQSYFVKGTQTSATNAFTGELLGITELKSGLAIDYWLPYNGTSSSATLNLTISDGTGGTKTTGAIAVYVKGTSRLTTHYTASNVIHMVYTKEGGTNGRTEGWWVTSYYDTNTDSATTYDGHYTPSSSSSEAKVYSASTGQYITGITLQRDGKGHVTGITGTTATDKDSYISAAAFSATTGSGVTMSLTRTGSTTGTVTATIPAANTTSYGVVHSTITATTTTGYSVCPIINGIVYYKDTNTDSATTYNGHYTPSSSETKTYSASTGQYLTGISLQRDGKGHVTGITGTTATLSDKDSYISAATFSATTGNVKMTLTRTGSTTGTVTADIPAATSDVCGVVKLVTGNLQSKKYTVGEAAAATHTHGQYSETGHTHAASAITGGTLDIARIPTGTSNTTVALGNHTHSTYLKNPTATASTTADTIYIVGIKTGATQTGLYDSGVTITNASVKAKNGFFQTSDERLKTFTEDIEVDLDKLSELPKKKYYWTEDKDKVESIGTSAQKVRELFPEVVNVNEEGYLSVDYAKLSIVALAAIDELNKKNKLLEERLERLEKALLK